MEEQKSGIAAIFGGRRFALLASFAAAAIGLVAMAGHASAAPPANNAFASAQVLTGDPVTASGTIADATRQSGEPDHSDSGADATVWYQWTATDSGMVEVDACDENEVVAALAIYTGSQLNALTEIESGWCRTFFRADTGTTYRIAVAGYSDWEGPFSISLESIDAPANDSFASAVEVTGPTVSGTTFGATTEAGEPIHGNAEARASVWFSWTPAQSGTAVLDACDEETYSIDSIAAYTGTEVGSLTQRGVGDCQVVFPATAGTTYLIAIASRPMNGGEFELHLEAATSPANDDFAQSSQITQANPFPVSGTTKGATSEAGEPDHAESGATASVWYRVSFVNAGYYVFDACDEETDTVQAIAVYQGSSVANLNEKAAGYCRIAVELAASTTYRILVASYPGMWGDFTLKASYYALPANDSFASALPLNETTDVHGHNFGATRQAGEPIHAGADGEGSVWYSYSPSETGMATVSLCASFDAVIAVYEGGAVDALTEVASDDDSYFEACSSSGSEVTFPAEVGTTYRVAVDGYDEWETGTFGIRTRLAPGPIQRRLSVDLTGNGNGSVSSSPAGIDCGENCQADFDDDSTVNLTATPANGSRFNGWTGACSGTGSCSVTMDQARNVSASFGRIPAKRTLSVTADGPGSISSSPAGISCGSTCSAQFDHGTRIRLTAESRSGSSFVGWSGGCAGTGECLVDMTGDTSVRATFKPMPSNPALELILTPRVSKVDAGKLAVVKTTVRSIGDVTVEDPKLCVEIPGNLRRAVKKAGCSTFGAVAPGGQWKGAIRLKTTPKARGRLKLKVRLTSKNAPAKVNNIVLVVKPRPKAR